MPQAQFPGDYAKGTIFLLRAYEEAGAGGDFVPSYAKTDTPVKYFQYLQGPPTLQNGIIKRIHYRLKPTNAATYTLRLYQAAVAADYLSNLCMLYESPPLRATDVDYDSGELEIPFALPAQAIMFYAIEWTAAPGVTPGFIEVSGLCLA